MNTGNIRSWSFCRARPRQQLRLSIKSALCLIRHYELWPLASGIESFHLWVALCHGGIKAHPQMTASRWPPGNRQTWISCKWRHTIIHNLFIRAAQLGVKQHRKWFYRNRYFPSKLHWILSQYDIWFVISTMNSKDIPGVLLIRILNWLNLFMTQRAINDIKQHIN